MEDQQRYEDKLKEVNTWMEPVEKKLNIAMKEEPGAGTATNLLQFLLNERDQAEGLLSNLTILGEKALPETSTQGRERSVLYITDFHSCR